ncbi:DUF3757 domain-containing protein [Legionella yabuuchiae]|uniref:DUF3757 domain-containing protein n=1 Tax=Legionella yabuuchiae TaxID=376727 RepID=UPI001056B773|nr:DUF3757 domain-containing protein [Legionella yabuuchiae]
MSRFHYLVAVISLALFTQAYAAVCPHPETSSLAWGEVPEPWQVNPFSEPPQGEEGTRFVRANILLAGMTVGVMCTYQNSLGNYSIWWQTRVKRPARTEFQWHEDLGGYACTDSLETCVFYP